MLVLYYWAIFIVSFLSILSIFSICYFLSFFVNIQLRALGFWLKPEPQCWGGDTPGSGMTITCGDHWPFRDNREPCPHSCHPHRAYRGLHRRQRWLRACVAPQTEYMYISTDTWQNGNKWKTRDIYIYIFIYMAPTVGGRKTELQSCGYDLRGFAVFRCV